LEEGAGEVRSGEAVVVDVPFKAIVVVVVAKEHGKLEGQMLQPLLMMYHKI
jgi:hypothetical protein